MPIIGADFPVRVNGLTRYEDHMYRLAKKGHERGELSKKCLGACCSRQFCLDGDGVDGLGAGSGRKKSGRTQRALVYSDGHIGSPKKGNSGLKQNDGKGLPKRTPQPARLKTHVQVVFDELK